MASLGGLRANGRGREMDKQAVKDDFFEALLAVSMTRFPSVDERWALLRARGDAEKVLDKQSYNAVIEMAAMVAG